MSNALKRDARNNGAACSSMLDTGQGEAMQWKVQAMHRHCDTEDILGKVASAHERGGGSFRGGGGGGLCPKTEGILPQRQPVAISLSNL